MLDEVEDVVACGVGMGQDELGDGARLAGQEFAMRSSGQAVVSRLNGLLGGQPLLLGGRGSAEADQAGDLSNFEPRVAMQQEMAEQALRIVIAAAALAEGKGRLQQAALLGRQSIGNKRCLGEPLLERTVRRCHEESSLEFGQGEL
jgi:hypothetical protein